MPCLVGSAKYGTLDSVVLEARSFSIRSHAWATSIQIVSVVADILIVKKGIKETRRAHGRGNCPLLLQIFA